MPCDAGDSRAVADDLDDLLEGLEGEAREARRLLLRELLDDGCAVDELREAAAEDRLALLQVDRVLAGERTYTYAELAERSGIDIEVLRSSRAAFGLPRVPDDERRWDDGDVEVAAGLRDVLDSGVPLERVLELNRVIGRAMLQVAAASRAMIADALLRPGATEQDVSAGLAAAARGLVPRMEPTLAYVFESHLRELVRSDVIGSADIAAGRTPGAREMAVAFADLVGFTRMGEEVPVEELGAVVERLEHAAAGLVEKPVTLVKTIGDAVMLVSPAADPLLDVALRLVEADLPQLRVGVACGPALERHGDWYGSPVNQASRVTSVARPGSVLVTESVRRTAEEEWSWSFARERRLKGVGEVKLFRARRPEPGGAASAASR
jgi:adenylate cyclase